jgi:hypothetical protein
MLNLEKAAEILIHGNVFYIMGVGAVIYSIVSMFMVTFMRWCCEGSEERRKGLQLSGKGTFAAPR